MTSDEISRLRQLLDAGTRGPWMLTGTASSWLVSGQEAVGGMPMPIVARFPDAGRADATLIVELRNAAEELLTELEEAWVAIDEADLG